MTDRLGPPVPGVRANERSLATATSVALLLLVALAIGGGGSRLGLANLGVQLVAIAVLAAHPRAFGGFWRTASLPLRLAVAASLLLPLAQIIPLPATLSASLPGRELAAAARDLAGGSDWSALSLDPRRTLLALSALITPLAVVAVGHALPRERLFDLGWLIVAAGLVTVALGAVQVISNGTIATIFAEREAGKALLGAFANRNSAALLLVFALALALTLPVPRPHPLLLAGRLAAAALLLVGIVLTQSRTGLVLAALPLMLGAARALASARRRPTAGRRLLLAALALAAVGGGALALVSVAAPGRLVESLERFDTSDDPRRYIWDDASYAAARYWPAGAGMGNFDEVFQADESLENLTLRRAGRAHNDFLEVLIEAGAAGIALILIWAVVIAALAWRARRSPDRWSAWAGGVFLLATALQSITDYPLRTQTLLAMAAFALLLLARVSMNQGQRKAQP